MSPDLDFDTKVDQVLGRAFRLSIEPLEGIEKEAEQLAALAAGDVRVVEAARRLAMNLAEGLPGMITKQVISLLRRALEIGAWNWEA
ncbi:MAG TPA: hypothetical protein VLX59_14265 [Acidimicrobiales bacterium]|nr:hypothetical protein [Acidimicrobiales bacterium]